jgi:poly-gamma-glutamate capsule biosynthesis protein CapA/YwtB (metallophosphatase superfamily)
MAHQPAGIAIGLLGDVMLGRLVAQALRDQPPEALWAPELRELAASLDLVVCNLECCISERGRPTTLIGGKPFFFRGPPAAVEALQAMNIRAVGLANNHALDFGEQALQDTLELLRAAGIATAGAGFGLDAAREAAVLTAAGQRVGVIAVTDHPVEYAAAPERWGVALAIMRDAPPPWLLEQIAAARERCDLMIVFPHWGPNMTTSPARWQRRAAASLHAAGADLVAGHSAHVFHGAGWNGGPTLFDLGDVLDDYMVDPELRNNLGVLAIWRPRSDPELELVGLRLEYCYTRLAEGADADWIAARLSRACRELGTSVTRSAEQRFTIELRIGNRQ